MPRQFKIVWAQPKIFISPSKCLIYFISKSIIYAHGVRYFFYVVNLELRKQGLSIFRPDIKPISSFQNSLFKEQYQNYLKNLNSKLEDIEKDMKIIITYFKKFQGKIPVNGLNHFKVWKDIW